jgi:hypothetical protein
LWPSRATYRRRHIFAFTDRSAELQENDACIHVCIYRCCVPWFGVDGVRMELAHLGMMSAAL